MTAGFYKYESPILLYGVSVFDANYHLESENKNDYSYPIDGWYWFNSQEEANIFFGIINEQTEEISKYRRFEGYREN